MYYDCIVIGGGPAGLMASIAAAEHGVKTLLIEKGNRLGRKLAISGGGRCNVTNRLPVEEIIKHIPGNGRFLYGAFSQFNNEDIITFFTKLGVPLKEEDHGRMFPVSNNAQTVVKTLVEHFQQLGGHFLLDTTVKKVLFDQEVAVGVVTSNEQIISTKAIIIATGGKSVPQTGSTGDGYKWAKKAGHTITDLFPTEVPLTSNAPFIQKKYLQGLSLANVAVSVLNPKGKAVITHQMDMIFTHFGLSGPAVLRCSQFVGKNLQKYQCDEVIVTIDVKPEMSAEDIFQEIILCVNQHSKKSVKHGLKLGIPERYLLFLVDEASIDSSQQMGTISHDKWRKLTELIKKFPVPVNGTLNFEKAFVTGGGVSIKEIEPKTMASKLVPNLYFCGEILDIHGYTGGYNITAALVTGRIAGVSAGEQAR